MRLKNQKQNSFEKPQIRRKKEYFQMTKNAEIVEEKDTDRSRTNRFKKEATLKWQSGSNYDEKG